MLAILVIERDFIARLANYNSLAPKCNAYHVVSLPNQKRRSSQQGSEAAEVGPVIIDSAVIRALGRFEDHRDAQETRIVYEMRKAGLTDHPLANVFVAIDPTAKLAFGVVQMDALDR